MLHGVVVRSPHAHARIVSIDTAAARSYARRQGGHHRRRSCPKTTAKLAMGEGALDLHDIGDNLLAHDKALYHGHAVAAVAATSLEIAREAAALVKRRVRGAAAGADASIRRSAPDAPILHDDAGHAAASRRRTPSGPTNVADADGAAPRRHRQGLRRGRHRRRARVPDADGASGLHRAARLRRALAARTASVLVWTTTQGPFVVRDGMRRRSSASMPR